MFRTAADGSTIQDNSAFDDEVKKAMKIGAAGAQQEQDNSIELQDNAANIAQPLQQAHVDQLNAGTDYQNLQNDVYSKTGLKTADAVMRDKISAADTNEKFRAPAAQLSLDAAKADIGYEGQRIKNQQDIIRVQRLNSTVLPALLADEQSTRNAINTQTQTRNNIANLADYNPTGVFTGSGDNRTYIHNTQKLLGESPQTGLSGLANFLPVVPTVRAFKQRDKVQELQNRVLASPTQ
jgi:hypothetical protein